MTIHIPIQRLPHGEGLPLPSYATPGSAGMDLCANTWTPILTDEMAGYETLIAPGEWVLLRTDLAIALPDGYEAQIRPRSGLAWKHGVTVLNAPGTIDADYRGEIKVMLINLGKEDFVVTHGDRIAQLVIAPVVQGVWEEVAALPETQRGEGGFGSTGV